MKIEDFEVIDHGVEHEQYFQGCGVSFTRWNECSTGCGNSGVEALEDALEQMATLGHEIPQEALDNYFSVAEWGELMKTALPLNDHHHYVSIRYTVKTHA